MVSTDSSPSAADGTSAGNEHERAAHSAAEDAEDAEKQAGRFRRAAKMRHPHHAASRSKQIGQGALFQQQWSDGTERVEHVEGAATRRCNYCDFANPLEAINCQQCGTKLELICSKCGYANPNGPESTECIRCNSPLPVEETAIPDEGEIQVGKTGTGTGTGTGIGISVRTILAIVALLGYITMKFGDDIGRGDLYWPAFAMAGVVLVAYLWYRRKTTGRKN